MSNRTLRRAAILIASLDTQSADALLDEMAPEQAALVRNAVMELGDIDIVEQQEVISQFVGRDQQPTRPSDGGVEIDPDLARKFGAEPDAHVQESHPRELDRSQVDAELSEHGSADRRFHGSDADRQGTGAAATPVDGQRVETPFAFLKEIDIEDVVRVLVGEHPQTTAIVVAHLAPEHAADVLGHLPRDRQTEVLMRIARLTPPHPDVLGDLEQELRGLLAKGQREKVDEVGLATVEAILQNTPVAARQSLVTELSQQDTTLVRYLRLPGTEYVDNTDGLARHHVATTVASPGPVGPSRDQQADSGYHESDRLTAATEPALDFAALQRFDSTALAQVLRRSSSNTTLLALAGASHEFVQRILAQLPKPDRVRLERKIQQIGPLRLDDVQRAQQQLSAVAQQLIDEGVLSVASLQRLSVAA